MTLRTPTFAASILQRNKLTSESFSVAIYSDQINCHIFQSFDLLISRLII